MFKKTLIIVVVLLLATRIAHGQLKVGDKAPEIVITNWLKNVPASKTLNDKFVIIDFWATWCAPCLETVPHMNNLVNKNRFRSNLIFIALTDEKVDKANWLLKRVPFSSVVVTDTTRQTLDNYKVSYIPYCAIIDDKNQIQWVGRPSDLTNDIISDVIERKTINIKSESKYSLPEGTKSIYDSLQNRYISYFDDQDLKEYFNMGPVIPQGRGANYFRGGENFYYNEVVVGENLTHILSKFLEVSNSQILLPSNLSTACISYCYKSVIKNKKRHVLDTILNHLNLKYKVADSLMNVVQLEVIDKDLFYRFASDPIARIAHSSFTDTYAAIEYDDFSKLKRIIEEKVQKIIVLKGGDIFSNKMSMTIKIDNMRNLEASLKEYGIKTTMVMKKLPVYKFD